MRDYERLKRATADRELPAVLVDTAALARNAERLFSAAAAKKKRLRVATKSVRVPDLLDRIAKVGGERLQGWMCYSAREARFLGGRGLDDFLVAYPSVRREELSAAADCVASGKRIALVVDSIAHLDAVDRIWEERNLSEPLRVVIDVDVSFRRGGAHLGVRRSPIRDLAAFQRLAQDCSRRRRSRLTGVMAYEAQVAGLADRNPFAPWMNPVKRALKRLSVPDVRRRREEIARWLSGSGLEIEIFNGGGTGSLSTTADEPWITEVTAGSGFLQPALFDYYEGARNEPAYCFALAVTRVPEPEIVTCQGGGFVASGEVSPDKCPVPFLPKGLAPFPREGFGEVQTPLRNRSGVALAPGDPVFLRPAKAGELAERFNEYWLLENDTIVAAAPTYRGLGQVFH